jgi:cytochrome c oxidase cbb3-type subunit 2
MPSYTWLAEREVDGDLVTAKLEVLQLLGDPYTDEQIAGAAGEVAVGTNRRNRR